MLFNRICVIGVGLIGGSVALAARRHNLCKSIIGYSPAQDIDNLELAVRLGVIDQHTTSMAEALADADGIFIAAPVGAMPSIFALMKSYWRDDVVYTDTGSTKTSVIGALSSVFDELPCNFVPGHPIAGAERSGAAASTADLFDCRRVILTPMENTDEDAVAKIQSFWETLGASVTTMSASHHDTVLAATSHLPHILAFALVGLLGRKDEQREIFKYAAGGFRDFTRIASSDPTMWQDICLANKQKIVPLIQQFQAELSKIEQLLVEDQSAQLFETFTYARNARQRFLDQQED